MITPLPDAFRSTLDRFDLSLDYLRFRVRGDESSIRVKCYDDGELVARFGMDLLPANPFYLYFWGVEVKEEFRGLGIGQELLRLRLAVAEEVGVHTVFVVVNENNDVENHIMEKFGFERSMQANHDGQNTAMWSRPVPQPDAVPA
jgi:ribosomal protein S18 acetylase RimI-like enzyme